MKNLTHLGSFQVTQSESNYFAKASGDFNPLHVNPVLARRYQFGTTVIHGVCGFFKALDLALASYRTCHTIVSVRVQFVKPVLHDQTVDVYQSDAKGSTTKLELYVNGKRTQIIDVEFAEAIDLAAISLSKNSVASNPEYPKPDELVFSDAESLKQSFELVWEPELIDSLFKHVKRVLPDNQTAVLLGLTNIVGMQCPGINSVFAGFNVCFDGKVESCDSVMTFNVSKADPRFSLITIDIEHNTASGQIEALFRPEPVRQPAFKEIKTIVPHNVFAQQNALIIGGSRGAGEVTAKLIAAGGGYATITYARGQSDAQSVAQDIQSGGGKCDIYPYNVLQPEADITSCYKDESITHIYYFASPLIEKSDDLVWDRAIFEKLIAFYLAGLTDLLRFYLAIPEYRKQGLTVYIPSTIFIEQPQQGFSEYIAAKSAVEAFANQFVNRYKSWKFVIPRLPRMLTDQTSGVANDPPLKSAETILNTLLAMPADK